MSREWIETVIMRRADNDSAILSRSEVSILGIVRKRFRLQQEQDQLEQILPSGHVK